MEKELKLLYGGIGGVIILAIIVWLFNISISKIIMEIIIGLIVLIAVGFFAKDYMENKTKKISYSKDEMLIAKDHAVNFWKEKTNGEIITDIWYNRKYFHPFYFYCFLMKKIKATAGDIDKEVWIVVSLEKKHPKIVSVTDENLAVENESESIGKRAEDIWNAFNPDFSGTPTEGINPEQSDNYLKKRTKDKTVSVFHNTKEKKSQGIMDNPSEEDENKT